LFYFTGTQTKRGRRNKIVEIAVNAKKCKENGKKSAQGAAGWAELWTVNAGCRKILVN